jgi:hypothetical protein
MSDWSGVVSDAPSTTPKVTVAQCISFAQVTDAMIDVAAGTDLEDYVQEVLYRQDARLLRRIGAALYASTDAGIQADLEQVELLRVRADLRRSYATKLVSYQFEPLPGDFRTPDPSEMRKLADADDKEADGILAPILTTEPSNFLGAIAGGGIDDTEIQPGILGLNY